MLEIFLIALLCNTNKKNALARGRNPALFIALTIILWVGLEFAGAFVGAALGLEMTGSYGLALAGAVIGALISYVIARFGSQGTYIHPTERLANEFSENYVPLSAPCEVRITREKAASGSAVGISYILNKRPIGNLSNGQSLTTTTDQKQNILVIKDFTGSYMPPVLFEVPDAGRVDLHFRAGKFLPQKSSGLIRFGKDLKVDTANAIPRRKVCPRCGSENGMETMFCERCGEKL